MFIDAIELASTELEQQAEFYKRLLGVAPLEHTNERLSFQIGASRLTFVQQAPPPARSYHFAFNIPEHRFGDAERWIRQYVPLIADNTGRDTFYTESWDAHNLYFYDAAGNILELIACHALPSTDNQPFSARSLQNISEVGIASDNVAAQLAQIEAQLGAAPYRWDGNTAFAPIGDEHGLLIVVQRGRIWFPDTGISAAPLPLRATLRNGASTQVLSWS